MKEMLNLILLQVDALQHALAKYLMELSLVDYDMCHVPPSKLAAGALCLSIRLLEDEEWVSVPKIFKFKF